MYFCVASKSYLTQQSHRLFVFASAPCTSALPAAEDAGSRRIDMIDPICESFHFLLLFDLSYLIANQSRLNRIRHQFDLFSKLGLSQLSIYIQ